MGFISNIHAFVAFNNSENPYMQINAFFADFFLELQKRLTLQSFSYELFHSGFHISKGENNATDFSKKKKVEQKVFFYHLLFRV